LNSEKEFEMLQFELGAAGSAVFCSSISKSLCRVVRPNWFISSTDVIVENPYTGWGRRTYSTENRKLINGLMRGVGGDSVSLARYPIFKVNFMLSSSAAA
jgi:hypothetical protein